MNELRAAEKGCLKAFSESQDATHLLVLADAYRELGESSHAQWGEDICRGLASDATLHESAAWFYRNWPIGHSKPNLDDKDSAERHWFWWSVRHAVTERWMHGNCEKFQLTWDATGVLPHEYDIWFDWLAPGVGTVHVWSQTRIMLTAPIRDTFWHTSYYPLGKPRGDFRFNHKDLVSESYPPQQRFAEVALIESVDNRPGGRGPVPVIAYPYWLTRPEERPRPDPGPPCVFRRHNASHQVVALFPTEIPTRPDDDTQSTLACRAVYYKDGTLRDDYRYYSDYIGKSSPAYETWSGVRMLQEEMHWAGVAYRTVLRAPPDSHAIRRKKMAAWIIKNTAPNLSES